MNEGQDFALTTPRRRAIVFADLMESVRLYEQFETRTIDNWRRFAALARDSLAPAHAGRLVRVVGDGLLLEFDTAAAATAAAHALHQALASFNGPDAGEAAMWLRVGVHLADVVTEEHELWGNGVNLAARLAAIAQPGQTAASTEVRADLTDGVHAHIEDLGLRYMKHVSEPMRVWLLNTPGANVQRNGPVAPSSADLRPAIAVVPFMALPADAEHDALGHAMADDIIASLSRHPGLRVLSRVSTAAVRGVPLELPRLRELLGASFLLSGHFYVRGNRVRLAAELCELQGGQVLWAGGVGGDVDALFEGQDELVPHIVSQVSQQVMAHELARVRSLPMDSLASYSLLLGANGLLHSLVQQDFGRAREVLEHLAERHPREAAPPALMSAWHVFRILQGWAEDPAAEGDMAMRMAARAMDNNPEQPTALVADGVARIFTKRDFKGARQSFNKAVTCDPTYALAWARLSETESQAGEHETALASASRAIDLSPLDPQRFVYESFAATAAWKTGSYGVAARHARESIRLHAMHAPPHRLLIASLWFQAEHEQARTAVATYLRLMPGSRVSASPSTTGDAVMNSPFAQALLQAGLPP